MIGHYLEGIVISIIGVVEKVPSLAVHCARHCARHKTYFKTRIQKYHRKLKGISNTITHRFCATTITAFIMHTCKIKINKCK